MPSSSPSRAARLLAAVLLFLGASSAAAQTPSRITGVVTDAVGHPLPAARVAVVADTTPWSAVVDAEGRFTFEGLPAGAYTIRATALGYRVTERRVDLAGGATEELRLVMTVIPRSLATVVVSATRTPATMATIPSAVTVLGREAIERQAQITPRLGDILGHLVPGLAAPTQSMSNYGQSLRGRRVSVLIDGVPQSTSRNAARDFATIDPAAIERIEVVSGPTAIYGEGATGGVVNIITRRAAMDGTRFTTEIGSESSLSAPGDGTGGRFVQSATHRAGALDAAGTLALRRTGSFFDAEGDMIPPSPNGQGGLSETGSIDFTGTVGWTRGAQRLALGTTYFRARQETSHATDFSVDTLPAGSAKAGVIDGAQWDEPQGAENVLVNADWTHESALGGRMHAQAYWRDYMTRFYPYDGLGWVGYVFQSRVVSDKVGGRVDFQRALPVLARADVLLGLDVADERTSQPVSIMDSATWVNSDGLVARKVGDRPWVPEVDLRTAAAFAQINWSPVERLSLRGGVRREHARARVDDFTTIRDVDVEGGERTYEPTLFNIGAILNVTDAVATFANYSEGFSVADLGRVLRDATDAFVLGSRDAKPQQVDNVEAGVRGAWSRVQATVSAFRNESELGASYDVNLNVVRAPQRVRGVEALLDAQPLPRLALGGTFSWTEGEYRRASDGRWIALDGYTIPPIKVTAYGEHRFTDTWTARLQVLHSGNRDRAFRDDPEGYGVRPVESYTVVDALTRVDVGPGTLTAAVENLFNTQYFPVVSQVEAGWANSTHAAAPGATLRLGYTVRYGGR